MPSLEGVALGREGLDELVVNDVESDGHGAVGGLADDSFAIGFNGHLVGAAVRPGDFAFGADGHFRGGCL